MHRTRSSPAHAQAVHLANSIRSRRGEDVAKLEGGVRGRPGMSHFELARICTLFFPRFALISHILSGRSGKCPSCPTGLNLFLGTVVFDQAQRRSFPWSTYTGEGLQGHYKYFGFPIGDFRRTPLNGDRSNVKSILGGLLRLDISSSHCGCCCSPGQQAALGFRRRNAATLAVRTGRWQSPAKTATPRRLGAPSRPFPSLITTKQDIRCGACTKECNAYSAM